MKDLSKEDIKEVLTLAYDFGFKGFGGNCAAAAMAINRVLFNGRGKFILVVNEALWTMKKHFAGHVVVEFDGVYWDGDARPKQMSDIDDWGDLSDDPYYASLAKEYQIRWTRKRATSSAIFETAVEDEIPFGHTEVEEMTGQLQKTLTEYLKQKSR